MTPIEFLIENREAVLNAYAGSPVEAWRKLVELVQAKSKLNIAGWTVAKSGKYYRAFRKIKGRVYGVHLGKDLTDAETKITAKQLQIQN